MIGFTNKKFEMRVNVHECSIFFARWRGLSQATTVMSYLNNKKAEILFWRRNSSDHRQNENLWKILKEKLLKSNRLAKHLS